MNDLVVIMSRYGYAENPVLPHAFSSTFTNDIHSLVKVYKTDSTYRIESKIIIGNEVIKSVILENVSNLDNAIRNIHDAIMKFDYGFNSLLNKISFDK